ncbi:MAG: DNA-binding transcriptional regulator [Bryobacteraceae bacterium]|nr:DNA-binding transcriptional regulator [Bryobacteraceae bacterium]
MFPAQHLPVGTRRVALIYDATTPYDLQVVRGVTAYIQQRAKWSVYIEESTLKDQRLPDLGSWGGDGIIADFDHPLVAAAVVRSKLPAVAFGSGYGWYAPKSQIPYFFTNNRAIARLGADHLLDKGFRHFAYCGYPKTPINGWSEEREREFAGRLKERNFLCEVYRGRHRNRRNWAHMQADLSVWLQSLPKPVGLMAANDNRARHVLEAARLSGLKVPAEVAVIGVDNDEMLCGLSSPLLTSIEQGAQRIGYKAAALLDRIMGGNAPARKHYVIDPVGIVSRLSTDVLSVNDSQIADAMTFIKEHACDGIKVPDVVTAVRASRSSLDARFKSALGRTLHTAIRDVQLEQARSLFLQSTLSPKEVAASTGFRSVQHMSSLFREAYGLPPAEYRRSVRMSG